MKLNLGAGDSIIDGFIAVDRKLGSEVFPLSYPDGAAEVIRASHVLEHFGHRQTLDVLKEWVRVLQPGGVLRIAVPDLKFACENMGHPHFEGWVMGGQTDGNDHHGALFTVEKLTTLLQAAGLQDIQPWKSEIRDCAALPVSLNLQGTKPLIVPKIACALSMPRLGFNDTWGCIQPALQRWDIPIRRYTGVWWERSLQCMFEDLLEEGFELVVTVDYDTLFTEKQFGSLLHTIICNPEMDAVCGIQAQRGTGIAMFSPSEHSGDKSVADVDLSKPFKVDTSHFGLTILRLQRLVGVRKPWFLNVPGKDGSWKRDAEGIVDADIYFWNQWKAAGRSLYMLPWVSIGHIECLVSKIDPKTGENYHVYAKDWINQTFGLKVKREGAS